MRKQDIENKIKQRQEKLQLKRDERHTAKYMKALKGKRVKFNPNDNK